MPSVRRVGSCNITGSPISSTVVGRLTSSCPMCTRSRSSGQGAVGSSVGSSSPASCRTRLKITGAFRRRASSSSKRYDGGCSEALQVSDQQLLLQAPSGI